MRKVLGFSCLVCLLVVGLACSGDSSTPTAPSADTSLTPVTAGVSVPKTEICHRNFSDPFGVVTEVTGQSQKRHSKHLASGQDCVWQADNCLSPGDTCDPTDSTWGGSYYICNACL